MRCGSFHVKTNNCTTTTTTTTTMYELQPIVTLKNVRPHFKLMYEMRNIHEDKVQLRRHDDAETPPGTKMPDVTEQNLMPNYEALETRQNAILKRLAELKNQIQVLRQALNVSNVELKKKEVQSENENNCRSQQEIKGFKASLVLNVNPWKPPYSIYALQKIWSDIDIKVYSYTHSTIIGRIPVSFRNYNQAISNNIELTLIYKAVEDLELITQMYKHPIIGEVNFLRYLSRLIDTHNYENESAVSVCATDHILDLCCRIRHQTSREKTDELLSILHEELKGTEWSGIGEPRIVDIAAWSTIKQFSSRRRVPQYLHEWYERCENTFLDKFSTC